MLTAVGEDSITIDPEDGAVTLLVDDRSYLRLKEGVPIVPAETQEPAARGTVHVQLSPRPSHDLSQRDGRTMSA